MSALVPAGSVPRSLGSRSDRPLRYLCALLLFAGCCLSARALYMRGKAALAGALVRVAWEEIQRTGRPTRPWPWADTHPIGRLRIPALGYDEVILEGASPRNLAFGPARLMSGAAPGEPGNLVLAGHRTSWFLPLKDARPGQEIVVESLPPDGGLVRRTYRVREVKVIDPADRSFLGPTPEDVLTLITCYPFGSSPDSPSRFVVRAAAVASARSRRVPARGSQAVGYHGAGGGTL